MKKYYLLLLGIILILPLILSSEYGYDSSKQNGGSSSITSQTIIINGSATGNCPAGYVVQNVTATTIQCVLLNHNQLAGLQGLGSDYFHLDLDQYNNLTYLHVWCGNVGNSSWNQSLADTLYYSINNPLNFENQTQTDLLYYSITNPENYLNTTTIDNSTIVRAGTFDCASGYVLQNYTINSSGAFGICVIQSSGNSSFNQSLTDTLYYSITNPNNYLNITTISNETIVRTGNFNCTTGQVLMNVTVNSSGIFGQCVTVSDDDSSYFNITGTGLQSSGQNVSANLSFFDERYLSSNMIYFLWNVTSGVSGYNIMNTTISNRTQQTQTFTGLSGNQTIAKWINPNTNITFIQGGLGAVHIHIQQTAGTKNVAVYVNATIRRLDNSEYQLAISETSDTLTGNVDEITVHTIFPTTILNATDRIEFELNTITTGAGTAPRINIYTEGSTASHLSFPVNEISFNPVEVDPLSWHRDNPLETGNFSTSGIILSTYSSLGFRNVIGFLNSSDGFYSQITGTGVRAIAFRINNTQLMTWAYNPVTNLYNVNFLVPAQFNDVIQDGSSMNSVDTNNRKLFDSGELVSQIWDIRQLYNQNGDNDLAVIDYSGNANPNDNSISFDLDRNTYIGGGGSLILPDYNTVATPLEGMIAWDFGVSEQVNYNGTAWRHVVYSD